MRKTSRRSRLNDRGISIVELLVGVVLLAVVVISLAASGMYSSRTLTRSRVQLEAAEFVQSEVERLLAVPYDSLRDGSRETEVGASKWEIEERYSHRQIFLVTQYAPTEAISVWDTVVAYRLAP
jgi:Tfp pilus assembly protein PilV